MPREVVMQKWCDACFADGNQMTLATITWTAGAAKAESPPALHMIDVCEPHSKQFEDIAALINVAPPFKRPTLAPAPKPQPKAEASDDGRECPVCHDFYQGRSTLVNHIWTIHRPGEKRPVGQVGKCPDCGENVDTPQGFAAHRRLLHKWSAVDEALSGVRGFRLVKAKP